MSNKKTPLDQALDVLVYAPLGLALSVRDLLPQLAERGRQQLTGQATTAKLVGEFAVRMGQQEAEKAVRRARQQAEDALSGVRPGRAAAPEPPPPAPSPTAAELARDVSLSDVEGEAEVSIASPLEDVQTSAPATDQPVSTPGVEETLWEEGEESGYVPDVGSLGIPGYDTLSASQVVQRLAGLSRDELEAVRAYEAARRSRKTILNRVAQLQSTNGWS